MKGVVEYCSRKSDRFVGLGVVTLQERDIAVRELDYIIGELKLKGVEILTNVDGMDVNKLERLVRPKQKGVRSATGGCWGGSRAADPCGRPIGRAGGTRNGSEV